MKKLKVRLKFTEGVLGTSPADEEISTWMQPPRPEPDDELDMADVHKFMVNHKQKESEDEL